MPGSPAELAELEGDVGEHLDQPSTVCGVIDWYGPMNLLTLSSQHLPDSEKRPDDAGSWESSMVGSPLQADPSRTRAASPISYVRAGAPPIQIHHGTSDGQVPFAQSVEFADAQRQAGGDVELIVVEGSDHFWTGAPDLAAIFEASVSFAHRVSSPTNEENSR